MISYAYYVSHILVYIYIYNVITNNLSAYTNVHNNIIVN